MWDRDLIFKNYKNVITLMFKNDVKLDETTIVGEKQFFFVL
jgi:hypothetical protein